MEKYTAGEYVHIYIIELPTKDLQQGNITKMIFLWDKKHVERYLLVVRQEADGPVIYYFNHHNCDWEAEDHAPADTEELLGLVLDILDQKHPYHRCLSGRCPICGASVQLGVTEEELEGFRKYQEEDEDLEDALPDFGPFEREFILSGMCPDCHCKVFRKELPRDMSRWNCF